MVDDVRNRANGRPCSSAKALTSSQIPSSHCARALWMQSNSSVRFVVPWFNILCRCKVLLLGLVVGVVVGVVGAVEEVEAVEAVEAVEEVEEVVVVLYVAFLNCVKMPSSSRTLGMFDTNCCFVVWLRD